MPAETFLGRFPTSPRASAAAYLRYAEGQHPWLLVLIPDLGDLERLTAVADGTAE
ncbi:hypothetical protein [Cellulomonas rhizosphaerae]|uniref:hypothetical protein n=1 Tax=Cellulomonas rhizosphaerae TaxID=2293719 RepID=UPI0013140ED1|nr:hypothetical protein [Cellulomonas rhizosphaerae]